MKCAFLALCLAAASANEYFSEGDAPICRVVDGRTTVFYDHDLASHSSFKCEHDDDGNCACAAHPTHHVGGCREFDHTDATTHQVGGDCADQCDGVDCGNGTCVDGNNAYTCTCSSGWQTDASGRCTQSVNDCAGVDCGNGTCVDAHESYTCTCNAGYEGDHCQTAICVGCTTVPTGAQTMGCSGQVVSWKSDAAFTATATIKGGDGGNSATDYPANGGIGGTTTVKFNVAMGDTIQFTTGCKGGTGTGHGSRGGGGGGGGSGIKINGAIIAVAGGGGGAAGVASAGGGGGGTVGGNGNKWSGSSVRSSGGTQSGPGSGAHGDRGEPNGSAGNGHNGGDANGSTHVSTRAFGFGFGGQSTIRSGDGGGGGGGGGYYGGGGGASGVHGQSGAGGSGYCNNGATVQCSLSSGGSTSSPSNGYITFTRL